MSYDTSSIHATSAAMTSRRLQALENYTTPSSPIMVSRALAQNNNNRALIPGTKGLQLRTPAMPKRSSRVPENDVVIDIEERKEEEKKHPRILAREILQSRSNSPAAALPTEFPTPVPRRRQISDPSPIHDSNGALNAHLSNMYKALPASNIEFKQEQVDVKSLWTEEIVKRFMEFSDICKQSAKNCESTAKRNRIISISLKISLIILGALVSFISIRTLPDSAKEITGIILGFLIAALTGILQVLNPEKNAQNQANSALELDRMARSINIEISKSPEMRVDPFDFIVKLENQREKLLKLTGMEDES